MYLGHVVPLTLVYFLAEPKRGFLQADLALNHVLSNVALNNACNVGRAPKTLLAYRPR